MLRSLLFVPGDRPERIAKALASGADAVIVDLEDAVAPVGKRDARDALAQWLDGATGSVWVRINACETAWFDDDVAACRHDAVVGVMVPKAENAAALQGLVDRLPGKPLMPLVESAAGLDQARALGSVANVQRMAFGSIDFQLDVGIPGDDDALLAFRSQLVLASRLAGCAPPIDGVTTAIDDAETLRGDADRARRLGFGGKLCIHPRQVAIVNGCFAPTEADLEWARRVVEAAAHAEGGAVAVDGRMVDRPVLLRARALLAQAAGPRR